MGGNTFSNCVLFHFMIFACSTKWSLCNKTFVGHIGQVLHCCGGKGLVTCQWEGWRWFIWGWQVSEGLTGLGLCSEGVCGGDTRL